MAFAGGKKRNVSASDHAPPGSNKKRKIGKFACDECKRQKARCDKGDDDGSCSNCKRRGVCCVSARTDYRTHTTTKEMLGTALDNFMKLAFCYTYLFHERSHGRIAEKHRDALAWMIGSGQPVDSTCDLACAASPRGRLAWAGDVEAGMRQSVSWPRFVQDACFAVVDEEQTLKEERQKFGIFVAKAVGFLVRLRDAVMAVYEADASSISADNPPLDLHRSVSILLNHVYREHGEGCEKLSVGDQDVVAWAKRYLNEKGPTPFNLRANWVVDPHAVAPAATQSAAHPSLETQTIAHPSPTAGLIGRHAATPAAAQSATQPSLDPQAIVHPSPTTHSQAVSQYPEPELWDQQLWDPQPWNPQPWDQQLWGPQSWNPQSWDQQLWDSQPRGDHYTWECT